MWDIVSQPDSVTLPQSPPEPVSQVVSRQSSSSQAASQFSVTKAGNRSTQPDQSAETSPFLSVEKSVTVNHREPLSVAWSVTATRKQQPAS